MTIDPGVVRARLRLLRQIDPEREVFGADLHQYMLAPPLTEVELAALERDVGALPDEYRAFVRTLGAHGAGPHYGLCEPCVPDVPDGAAPSPRRAFRGDGAALGGHRLDGTLVIADQGCGMRSLLVVCGPRAGEIWSDGDRFEREATGLLAWYADWFDRALVDWAERTAHRIALDGPRDPAELEACALAFELVPALPQHARTLGYLHLREKRWADADAAFARAAETPRELDTPEEQRAQLALDRGRAALLRGEPVVAIARADAGLAIAHGSAFLRDELADLKEHALVAAGRPDDALGALEARAAAEDYGLTLHHRLAREHLARNNIDAAGAALERAAQMPGILGPAAPLEERVAATFDPIVIELRAAGRRVDADALQARVSMILDAN